jgi:L-threonylcarbamoyladenylate synthase
MRETFSKNEPLKKPSAAFQTRLLAADAAAIAEAAKILRAGGLVAFPTETVYGLAADATSDAAVAQIYAAKGRPRFNPLIAHFGGLAAAKRQAVFGHAADLPSNSSPRPACRLPRLQPISPAM